jgi:hypothetical protein
MAGCILGIGFSENMVVVGVMLCLAGVASGSLSVNLYSVAQMFAGPRAAGIAAFGAILWVVGVPRIAQVKLD